MFKFAWLLREPKQGRLVRHYFWVFAVIIAVTLVASDTVELYLRHRESWQHFEQLHKEIAAGASFKIEQFIHEIERGMRAATRSRENVQNGLTADYQWELRRLLVNFPALTEAIAYDLDGTKQAAARRSRAVLTQRRWEPAAEQAVDDAKRLKTYFGKVNIRDGTGPFLRISVPIEPILGEVIGVLRGEIDLKHIRDVISSIRVGEAGHAFLISREGDLIAHPDLSLMLKQNNLAQLDFIKAAFKTSSLESKPHSFVANNMSGQKVFTTSSFIPEIDWMLFVEQPIKEIYFPLYASLLRTSVLFLVSLAVALVATKSISQRIARPIETLRQGVDQIGRGDLSARIELHTGDEIEILANEFNAMTTHLKDAYENLEHKVAERTRELTIANTKLGEVSEHKSRFLANVNHELRTPLSSIIGYARLVLRETEGKISSLQRENLEDLQRNAERLLTLIDGLLDIARIEAGKIDIQIDHVDIDELIRGIVATIQPMIDKEAVRLVQDIAPNLPLLYTDREKLRQIVLNLVSNAIKFTEQGEIKITASKYDDFLRLAVADTGIGIKQEELNKVFEEFHRGQSSGNGNPRGTGLGLAIVKRLLDVLGGDIRVESEIGKGSKFILTLPFKPRQTHSV